MPRSTSALFGLALLLARPALTRAQPGQGTGTAFTKVLKLSDLTLHPTVSRFAKMIVLMHDGTCEKTRMFQPWLHAVANMVPELPVGQVDVSQSRRALATAFKVETSPIIKMFMRDNPKGKRIIDYKGPLDFDRVLEWTKAVAAGREHSSSAFGAEPPEAPGGASRAAAQQSQMGGKPSAMSQLPESVRMMAQTMVREQRLTRILKERGGGRAEHYQALVGQKYAKIVEDEGTDLEDKWAVQEANRRARSEVQEELLATAPANVRAEVEAEVNLGDMGADDGEARGGGYKGSLKTNGKKKKDEL